MMMKSGRRPFTDTVEGYRSGDGQAWRHLDFEVIRGIVQWKIAVRLNFQLSKFEDGNHREMVEESIISK